MNCTNILSDGRTSLHFCAQIGNCEIAEILLKEGVKIDDMELYNNYTALHIAVIHKKPDMISFLLKHGANRESKDINNWTPLCFAAKSGETCIVEILLHEGAEVDSNLDDGQTPLLIAAQYGFKDVVEILLKQGAKTDAAEYEAWTTLYSAAMNGYLEIVQLLIEHNANFEDAVKQDGTTPLHIASKNDHANVISYLARKYNDINITDNRSMTAIHYLTSLSPDNPTFQTTDNVSALESLIAAGADLEAKDESRNTAVHNAATNCNSLFLFKLIESGAEKTTYNNLMQTPLHCLALNAREHDTGLKLCLDPSVSGKNDLFESTT